MSTTLLLLTPKLLGQLRTATEEEAEEEEAEAEAVLGETLLVTPANARDFAVAAKPPVTRTAIIRVDG